MKLMAEVVFSEEVEHDSDSAADALRDAGYEVHRMPTVHPELAHPDDDFLITKGPAGPPPHDLAYPVGKMTRATMEDVGDWAECFGGTCIACIATVMEALRADLISLTFGEWCSCLPITESVERIKHEWGLADDTPLGWYGQVIAEGLLRGDELDDIARAINDDQELRHYGKCFMPEYPVTQFEKAFEQRFLNETDIGREIARHRVKLH